jgi:molybdopterin-guanine dinucleotide biosynthesis protein A
MIPDSAPVEWTAIVLTGGAGRRLGLADKSSAEVGGMTLFDHLMGALPVDVPVVVAGPERPTMRSVTFRAEEPRGTGPVAGIAAAVAVVGTPYVAVVAVDIPWSAPVVVRLMRDLAASADVDVLIPVDEGGRRQLLCSAWRTEALSRALDRLGDPRNRSVRDLVEGVSVRECALTAAEASLLADIDTPADLAREQRRGRSPTLGEGPSTD